MSQEVDTILEKLAKDVEAAVHALYRSEVRQATAKALGWDKAEGDAVLRCLTAWLPMGGDGSHNLSAG